MKKVIFTILALIIASLVLFPPHKISKGGGHVVHPSPVDTCSGLYIETYNGNASDGDRGGWCFGKTGIRYE